MECSLGASPFFSAVTLELARSKFSILQLLAIRQILERFKFERQVETFRGHLHLGSAAPGRPGTRPEQASGM